MRQVRAAGPPLVGGDHDGGCASGRAGRSAAELAPGTLRASRYGRAVQLTCCRVGSRRGAEVPPAHGHRQLRLRHTVHAGHDVLAPPSATSQGAPVPLVRIAGMPGPAVLQQLAPHARRHRGRVSVGSNAQRHIVRHIPQAGSRPPCAPRAPHTCRRLPRLNIASADVLSRLRGLRSSARAAAREPAGCSNQGDRFCLQVMPVEAVPAYGPIRAGPYGRGRIHARSDDPRLQHVASLTVAGRLAQAGEEKHDRGTGKARGTAPHQRGVGACFHGRERYPCGTPCAIPRAGFIPDSGGET